VRLRAAAATVALLACVAAAPAHATSRWSSLNVGVDAGIMSGAGPQGLPLGRGPYAGVYVFGESALGMEFGGALEFASSNDALHTKFTSLGVIARLSPTPEDYRVFVQLGASMYHATYDPDPGILPPDELTRPGGSFGIGWDMYQQPRWAAGLLVNYTGVLIARRAARSYVTVALNFTLKPPAY